MSMAFGTSEQKRMAQSALDRWWWPSLMMFGPSDRDRRILLNRRRGKSSAFLMTICGSNLLMTVPQAEYLGLTMPDPDLKWNEGRGHYDFGEIDWARWKRVVSGDDHTARNV